MPPDSDSPPRRSRIQRERRAAIREAALKVFAENGYRGATLDQIAEFAGLSKANLLYYYAGKEAIHTELIARLLDDWLAPLRALDPIGDPAEEIRAYIRRKLEMARDYPRESRLFAYEIIEGAPRISAILGGSLRALVDEKASVIKAWAARGAIAPVDPHHLIFAIWATTQHYADFDAQIGAVLGDRDARRFEDAEEFLCGFFMRGLTPEKTRP